MLIVQVSFEGIQSHSTMDAPSSPHPLDALGAVGVLSLYRRCFYIARGVGR